MSRHHRVRVDELLCVDVAVDAETTRQLQAPVLIDVLGVVFEMTTMFDVVLLTSTTDRENTVVNETLFRVRLFAITLVALTLPTTSTACATAGLHGSELNPDAIYDDVRRAMSFAAAIPAHFQRTRRRRRRLRRIGDRDRIRRRRPVGRDALQVTDAAASVTSSKWRFEPTYRLDEMLAPSVAFVNQSSGSWSLPT